MRSAHHYGDIERYNLAKSRTLLRKRTTHIPSFRATQRPLAHMFTASPGPSVAGYHHPHVLHAPRAALGPLEVAILSYLADLAPSALHTTKATAFSQSTPVLLAASSAAGIRWPAAASLQAKRSTQRSRRTSYSCKELCTPCERRPEIAAGECTVTESGDMEAAAHVGDRLGIRVDDADHLEARGRLSGAAQMASPSSTKIAACALGASVQGARSAVQRGVADSVDQFSPDKFHAMYRRCAVQARWRVKGGRRDGRRNGFLPETSHVEDPIPVQ